MLSSTKSAAVTCSRLLRGGCGGNNGIAISWAGCRPLPPRRLARPSSGRPVSSADEDLSSTEGFKGYKIRGQGVLPKSRGANPRLTFILACVGAGTAWAFLERWKKDKEAEKSKILLNPSPSLEEAEAQYALSEAPPSFPAAVENKHPGGGLRGIKKITLYQYRTCPFCCKVRAFLDYYGINHDVIEVNSVTRKQLKWSSYRKVPMLVVETTDGRHIQVGDSVLIVSALASLMRDQSQDLLKLLATSYPKMSSIDQETGKKKLETLNKYHVMIKDFQEDKKANKTIADEKDWRRWADNQLVHKISPNVYRTLGEALETFRWFDEAAEWDKHFEWWERYLVIYVGAVAMWLIAKRLKTRHHLKDDVRESLYDDARHLCKAIRRRRRPFLGGERPNLADLAAFGALSSFEGCRAFKDMQENTDIGPWFLAVKEAVAESRGRAEWKQEQKAGS